ncbi:MAG: protein tyrosine phosphatase, partial [Bombella apis]|nr:protein tyrosine phosphatase [Bombella apis]
MFDGTLSSPRQRLHAWLDGLFKDHALFRLVWTNLAPVIPGRVWRSNHPTPSRLRRWRKTLGLKTVFNLRGHRRCGADALGREMCQHIGLPYLDMAFESRNAPHKDRILRFHSLYKQAQFPLLLHCKSG